jgi:predicted RNase H-like HicB family nuclease
MASIPRTFCSARRRHEYTVIYEKGSRNRSAYVPDLPGCVATAKTQRQLERVIREAIQFHIEGLLLHGEPVPPPTIEAGKVRVVA